jgi:hypothetical protein
MVEAFENRSGLLMVKISLDHLFFMNLFLCISNGLGKIYRLKTDLHKVQILDISGIQMFIVLLIQNDSLTKCKKMFLFKLYPVLIWKLFK